MAHNLPKIEPLEPPLIPPSGSVAAGVTPNGQQLYKLDRPRSRAVPKLDERGNHAYRKHQVNGEDLYPLYKPELYTEHLLFFMESDHNGNAYMVPFIPPTEEQLAAEERERRIAAMRDELAQALVDADVSPDQLISALRAPRDVAIAGEPVQGTPAHQDLSQPDGPEDDAQPEVEETDPDEFEPDFSVFPKQIGPTTWELSNGETLQGSREQPIDKQQARAAEAALQELRFYEVQEAREQAGADLDEAPGF